jgi:hypothetical protein
MWFVIVGNEPRSDNPRMLRTMLIGLIAVVAVLNSPALAQSSDAISEAKRQVNQADSEHHKAVVALSKEAARIRKLIEDKPEWKQAQAMLKDGQTKYNLAVAAVRKSLQPDPAYQRAQKNYRDALNDKETLRANPDATPEQRTAAAVACLTASSEIGRLEQKALAEDTAADQAHTLIQQGNDQIEELKKQFGPVAQKDPAYQAARQRVTATETQLASAETNLSQAKAAQARTDEQRDNQQIESLRNSLMRNAGVTH